MTQKERAIKKHIECRADLLNHARFMGQMGTPSDIRFGAIGAGMSHGNPLEEYLQPSHFDNMLMLGTTDDKVDDTEKEDFMEGTHDFKVSIKQADDHWIIRCGCKVGVVHNQKEAWKFLKKAWDEEKMGDEIGMPQK